jgi:hypothetical protein
MSKIFRVIFGDTVGERAQYVSLMAMLYGRYYDFPRGKYSSDYKITVNDVKEWIHG